MKRYHDHHQYAGCEFGRNIIAALSVLAALTLGSYSMLQAAIVGPYAPDSATLHLWHLDESATPCVDSASSGTNLTALAGGATLANASFTGFGTALGTVDGGQAGTTAAQKDASLSCLPLVNSTTDNASLVYADPITGAFTMEAVVQVKFDPTLNYGTVANGGNGRNSAMMIVSGEDEANAGRIFQFRISPINTSSPLNTVVNLDFVNVHQGVSAQTISAPIPTTGPDAIVSNGWYHVAVVYNGNELTAGNIKFYWTAMDGARTNATEILSALMQFDLSVSTTDFAVGQTGRNGAGNNFVGLLDEVRISKIARATNGMMFADAASAIITQPVSQTVALGHPASFGVVASGLGPLGYQWQFYGTNIPGATSDSLLFAAAQLSNDGPYTVIITNSLNSVTSEVATLTVRTPLNLTWIGSAGSDWDSVLVNWDTNADVTADIAYTSGDHVTFNNDGSSVPSVSLTSAFLPSSVTVNSASDYTLTTTTSGSIGGITALTKSGAGGLIVDTDNNYSGGTTIQGGVLTIGAGGARGSLGTGVITNNSGIVINRTGTVTFSTNLSGSGALTNLLASSVIISGSNSMSGPISTSVGTLTLANAAAKGNSTAYVLNAPLSGTTTLSLSGGFTFGAGTSFSLLGTTASPDTRIAVQFNDSTNTINGPLNLSGDGIVQLFANTNTTENINSTINSPSFVGKFILRGTGGLGVLSSPITIGGHVSITDQATWVLNATGNTWTNTDCAGGVFRMGAANAFAPMSPLNVNTGTFDLGGYDQVVGGLYGYNTSTFALDGRGTIGSSSTNSDAILIVSNALSSTYPGVIRDSILNGTRRVGLTLTGGGSLTLTNRSTYSGTTTINAGTLFLANVGSMSNSMVISVASGAAIDATGRTDGTLTVSALQTLAGTNAFSVVGNLTNKGTIELKLNKAGATLTNDNINGLSQISYGGVLKLDVTASPALAAGDAFKLFSASSYVGTFTSLDPTAPGAGLAWDTSTLATDGIIQVRAVNTTPTNITAVVTGGGSQLDLSWPSDHTGWTLQFQTNALSVGISTNWVSVLGSAATNQVTIPINPANESVFFRMIYP